MGVEFRKLLVFRFCVDVYGLDSVWCVADVSLVFICNSNRSSVVFFRFRFDIFGYGGIRSRTCFFMGAPPGFFEMSRGLGNSFFFLVSQDLLTEYSQWLLDLSDRVRLIISCRT